MRLSSSNSILNDAFKWAQDKTQIFVVTGTKNGERNKGDRNRWYGPEGVVIDAPTEPWAQPKDYMPSFWAGYFDRTAYYIRDFVHQAPGAYFMGLEEENYNMFYTFVSNASEKTGWFAPWAFNFDNSIYYMDTPDNKKFVREITSQFELVETAYKLYLLSGDERYIKDEVIFTFIENVMTKLIDSLDGAVLKEKNGIPEGVGDIWHISATYNECGFQTAEAGDSIAAMYQAMIAYSEILKLRGETEKADEQRKCADKLRKYFNEEWSVVKRTDKFCYAIDNKGKKHYKWKKWFGRVYGAETLMFIPLKKLSYNDDRNKKLLDYIFEKQTNKRTMTGNIESYTYLPDLYFANNQPERAWYFMKYILSKKDLPHLHKSQGTNGDYPEISFTFISQIIEGMMGVRTNAKQGEITTCPDFPEDINDISLCDLKFGSHFVDIKFKDGKVVLKNNGTKPIKWHCNFIRNEKMCGHLLVVNPNETVQYKYNCV